MKILTLNAPYLRRFSRAQRSPAVTKSGTVYFPMWLAYATGVLMKEGHELDFIDAPADDFTLDDVMARAKEFGPKLIVIDTSTPSILNDVQVGVKLKEAIPGSFVVLVGTHVSAVPEKSLRIDPVIDAVALHEYDYTLVDLAKALETHGDWQSVQGIAFLRDGEFVMTTDRTFMKDWDEVPFVSTVYKKFLRIENYFNPNALFPMVTITTSRGCPFPCTFCVYPQTMTGHTFRLRSVENVVDEMEYIVENFPQAKAIFFEDDTLTINKHRCREMAELIIQRGVKISWSANARVGVDYETMKIMKEAGCRTFCVGFESGSQMILDTIKKRIKVDDMPGFVADAKKAGIQIHGCFIVGHPGESRETLRQTLDLAKKLNPDTAQFYPLMVYPGTESYTWYEERGLLNTDDYSKWLTPQGLHNSVVRTEELSAEDLVNFCDDARREFYLRPKYFAYKLGQMISQPREIRRNLKAARTFVKYLIRGSDTTPVPENLAVGK